MWSSSLRASRGRLPTYHWRLDCEQLEDRLVLAGVTGENVLQLFDTSSALFVENQGQWADESVRYAFHGAGANIGFTETGLEFLLTQREAAEETPGELASDENAHRWRGDPFKKPDQYVTRKTQFSVRFDGADNVAPVGLQEVESRFNYLIGDEADWRTDVPGYEVVAYQGLYTGIDLHTFGQRDSLKYEFHVAAGADYRQIQIRYDGIDGLWLDEAGALHVPTELGELVDGAPYVYQLIDGREVDVGGSFELVDAHTYTFKMTGRYDSSVELVIDPELAWSTYLGGSDGPHSDFGGSDGAADIAVDVAGNVFVTGWTGSRGFRSAGAFDRDLGGDGDAFVTKLTNSGSLVWSTYLGGSDGPFVGGRDGGNGIAVDVAGNVLVTGFTDAIDFPTTAGAFDRSLGGNEDAFVTKLTNGGSLAWSTYLGGSDGPHSNFGGSDAGIDIAVDVEGNVLVTGHTASRDFPTSGGAFDRSLGGDEDAFVTKLSNGGSLAWSTYLGGSDGPHSDMGGSDVGIDIALDAAGNVLVTGGTSSNNFPTTAGVFDRSLGGNEDAFVTKLSNGGGLAWSTYLGGSDGPQSDFGGSDSGAGITVDAAGNVLVTGSTASNNFPTTAGAFDRSLGADTDAFVTKLTSGGGSLAWSTYLGGSDGPHSDGGGWDAAAGISVDALGNVLVTGLTWSGDFPTTTSAFDRSLGGDVDAFVTKLTSRGSLAWSTYLGGSDGPHSDIGGSDDAAGIAVGAACNVLVTGSTFSNDFPTTAGAFDRSLGVGADAFVAKILIRDPGDANLDGVVDGEDFNIWNENKFAGFATWSMADFNADRLVDLADFNIWNENRFTQPSPGRIASPCTDSTGSAAS